ncbi:hypothetical protein U9M48_012978 [Paspalum notatum var. saurae]|uniref:Uncharacterized protein n=1 Tax=Paspalum notatum var. saurae TaxID=547442 RepID=A0AAQ3SYJ0_PASNO
MTATDSNPVKLGLDSSRTRSCRPIKGVTRPTAAIFSQPKPPPSPDALLFSNLAAEAVWSTPKVACRFLEPRSHSRCFSANACCRSPPSSVAGHLQCTSARFEPLGEFAVVFSRSPGLLSSHAVPRSPRAPLPSEAPPWGADSVASSGHRRPPFSPFLSLPSDPNPRALIHRRPGQYRSTVGQLGIFVEEALGLAKINPPSNPIMVNTRNTGNGPEDNNQANGNPPQNPPPLVNTRNTGNGPEDNNQANGNPPQNPPPLTAE